MRISPDGRHELGSVQGVYLDGQLVMPNAGLDTGGWDFVSDGILGFGGWGTSEPGLYLAALTNPVPHFATTANATHAVGLWTDGETRWLAQYADGAADSQGNSWPDRTALGSSRQGDWLFVTKPDFTHLIIRSALGIETSFAIGQFFSLGGMDNGIALIQPGSGPLMACSVKGSSVTAPSLPNAGPFVTTISGQRYICGYQPGWGLCLAEWEQAPLGWLLGSGNDFAPAIAQQANGYLVVVSGQNAGETAANVYVIDTAGFRFQVNGGPWQPKVAINIAQPPQPQPAPIQPIDKPAWYGWFHYSSNPKPLPPQNCALFVGVGGDGSITNTAGDVIGYFTEDGADEEDLDALNAQIKKLEQEHPGYPIVPYVTLAMQRNGTYPNTRTPGLEAYVPNDETDEQYLHRLFTAAEKFDRVWLFGQAYTSNGRYIVDLHRALSLVSRAFDRIPNADGILFFSGSVRGTGYQDHKEMWPEYDWLYRTIPSTPPLPSPLPPDPTPEPEPPNGGPMSYLSYQLVNGVPTAVQSNTIDGKSTFQQTGTCFALAGIGIGYNVMIFGAPIPGGYVNFQRAPMFTPGWDANVPGETGKLIPQANGTVAIQWPIQ